MATCIEEARLFSTRTHRHVSGGYVCVYRVCCISGEEGKEISYPVSERSWGIKKLETSTGISTSHILQGTVRRQSEANAKALQERDWRCG